MTENRVVIRNASTGEPITEPEAVERVRSACQDMLADPRLAAQGCYGGDLNRCMREAGFERRDFELLKCKGLGF